LYICFTEKDESLINCIVLYFYKSYTVPITKFIIYFRNKIYKLFWNLIILIFSKINISWFNHILRYSRKTYLYIKRLNVYRHIVYRHIKIIYILDRVIFFSNNSRFICIWSLCSVLNIVSTYIYSFGRRIIIYTANKL